MKNQPSINEILNNIDTWEKNRGKGNAEEKRSAEVIHQAVMQMQEQEYNETDHLSQPARPEEENSEKYSHEIFIEQMAIHGNRRIAYQKAYPGATDASARTGAWRLMMKEGIAKRIRQLQLQQKEEALNDLKEIYKGRLADIQEKRAILAGIIRGDLVPQKETTIADGSRTVKHTCDPKERIRAIMLDNKMEEEWRDALTLPNEGMRHLQTA